MADKNKKTEYGAKSELIKKTLLLNPQLSADEIVEMIWVRDGVSVSSASVYNVKRKLKEKSDNVKSKSKQSASKQSASVASGLSALKLTDNLVKAIGSFDKVREYLDILEKLENND